MIKKQATPYLAFSGNAREALEFYEQAFDGEIIGLQTYGQADFPTPPGADDLVIHAEFRKENLSFMAADSFPGSTTEVGNHISLMLELDSEEAINRLYAELAEGGTAVMELQDTFWGARYGKVKDKFGITWDLNYAKSAQ